MTPVRDSAWRSSMAGIIEALIFESRRYYRVILDDDEEPVSST